MERQKDLHLLSQLLASNYQHPQLRQQLPQSSMLNLLLATFPMEYRSVLNAQRCCDHQHRQSCRIASGCPPRLQRSWTDRPARPQPLYPSALFQNEIPPLRRTPAHKATLIRHRTIDLSATAQIMPWQLSYTGMI